MILFAGLAANCQDNKIWVNRETYRKNVSDLARLKVDSANMERLKVDTFRLNKVIEIKDRAFISIKEQLDLNRVSVDSLVNIRDQQKAVIAGQDELLKMKNERINKLEKQKGSVFKRVLHVVGAVVIGYAIGKF